MLDPRSLEKRRDEIAESCRKRRVGADVDAAIEAQHSVSALGTELQEVNRRRNEHQKAGKRKLEAAEREAHAGQGRRLKDAVAKLEARIREAQATLDEKLFQLPNFLHPDVPEGDEDAYRVLRTHGQIPEYDFEPQNHLEIGTRLDLIDFEGGARVAGQKFYFLKNEAALLELALQRYAVDVLIEEGFTPMVTPDLARPEIVDGVGYNPRGEETQIYSLSNANLCLVGTSEVTLGGLYADTIFDESQLPLKLGGISHCFRTEAGAAGRESKGLYRVHQFSKVEMFVYTRPEDSEAMHDQLVAIEERIFQDLELPYRVIEIASGDLGAPAYRKFDLEAWIPSRGEAGQGPRGDWGELTSASNCTDFQARRLKIRFRREGSKKPELVHTLNGTAVACARAILALLEVHQRSDGAVGVPEALQPYLGRDLIGPR
jgi:seryl-tRNA synthetase